MTNKLRAAAASLVEVHSTRPPTEPTAWDGFETRPVKATQLHRWPNENAKVAERQSPKQCGQPQAPHMRGLKT